jgi:predicted amidohydrolase YtcJ
MPKIACVIFFLLIALFSFACQQKTEAEVMYVNGRIYTGLPSADTVEVVLTAGDTIIYAGSRPGAEPLRNEKTRIVDLAGAFMYPGFIEGHAHLMGIGYQQLSLNLAGANSYAEIVAMVADAVAKTPGNVDSRRGWHQSKWQPQARPLVAGFPTHTQLSQISPEHPVFLTHASGHAILVNARAMAIAGISDETRIRREARLSAIDVAGQPAYSTKRQKSLSAAMCRTTAKRSRTGPSPMLSTTVSVMD